MVQTDFASDEWLQRLYVSEIGALCEEARLAAEYLNDALGRQNGAAVFYHLRVLVSTAATVSQFLWPIQERDAKAQERGRVLRELLSVSDDSPLRSREFRHHLIHVDERLDTWAEESPNRNIARKLIGPRGMIGGDGITSGDLLEHFVPGENVFIFRGDEYQVQAIVSALMQLRQKASLVEEQLSGWPVARQRNA